MYNGKISIFCNLPNDIINYILLYDDHFILRKGKIISIIPKTDERYKLLSFITFKLDYVEHFNNFWIRYVYIFPNLYNYDGRRINNSDTIHVSMQKEGNNIKYSIWIGRQYPKTFPSSESSEFSRYYIENSVDYNWVYTEYEYIRDIII